jgi:hypothetical protein
MLASFVGPPGVTMPVDGVVQANYAYQLDERLHHSTVSLSCMRASTAELRTPTGSTSAGALQLARDHVNDPMIARDGTLKSS